MRSRQESRRTSYSFSRTILVTPTNLRARQPETYRRLVRAWYDWNAMMLPEIKESFTVGFSGYDLADHFGAKSPDGLPDIPTPPED